MALLPPSSFRGRGGPNERPSRWGDDGARRPPTAVKSRRRKIFSRRKRGLIPVRIAFPFPSLSETPTPVVVERTTVSWRLFILLGLNSTGLTPLFTRTCFGGGDDHKLPAAAFQSPPSLPPSSSTSLLFGSGLRRRCVLPSI